MIFTADVMVLKAENRPFVGRDGKQVPYARATVIDNVGNLFEMGMPPEMVEAMDGMTQKIVIADFELSKTTKQDGKPSLRLRLLKFTPRK